MKVKSLSRVRLFATPWTAATRLLRPWDFPGKSTGVGYHCSLCLDSANRQQWGRGREIGNSGYRGQAWAAVRPGGLQGPWAPHLLHPQRGVAQRADYKEPEGSEGWAASSPAAPPSLQFLSICQGGAVRKTEPAARAPESPELNALDTGAHARPSPRPQPHGVSRMFWETLLKGILLA